MYHSLLLHFEINLIRKTITNIHKDCYNEIITSNTAKFRRVVRQIQR